MSVMNRCFRRFAAGLVGAFLALAVIAVPSALANGDTINAQATVGQFSGPVDNPSSCTNRTGTTTTIDWGDGTQSNGVLSGSGSTVIVSGTHTYAESAVATSPEDGTVTFTGGHATATRTTSPQT